MASCSQEQHVCVRVVIQKEAHDRCITVLGCHVKSSNATHRLAIDVCGIIADKLPHYAQVPFFARDNQRRDALIIEQIRVSIVVEKKFDNS